MPVSFSVELPLAIEFAANTTRHPYVLVDVFTSAQLEGNQLGVFTDARGIDEAQMQRLALEVNYAESVFFLPSTQGADLRIRIFTPSQELPFAGHPVLGSAVVAATALGRDAVSLETGSGTVTVTVEQSLGGAAFGRFERPAPPAQPHASPDELLAALGVEASLLPVDVYANGPLHAYVALPDEAAVAAVSPDFATLADVHRGGATCFAGSGRRWTSRMFAPALGVPEDPATGSAAGPLAIHLARHGWTKFGEQIEIHQGASIGRPSVLYATAHGDTTHVDSMEVAGSAVIVASGEYRLN